MLNWVVYVLLSERDGRTYVGSTNDLERRLASHNNGLVTATKYRTPLKVVYTENFESESEARSKEKYYKTGAGRRKLRLLFN